MLIRRKMIRSLNLDSKFIPTVFPEIEFKLSRFSGGEYNIKLNTNIDYSGVSEAVITMRGTDLMPAMIAKDALMNLGVDKFKLVIPYFPYARQDKIMVPGESFTLKVYSELINSMNFNEVIMLDAHSLVTPALVNHSKNVSPINYVRQTYVNIGSVNTLLISPDSGANKKLNWIYDNMGQSFAGLIKCDKVRNVTTRQLSDFQVFADDLKGAPCLIVDDICDGGRTFIGLAKELKNKNAGDLYLYVSHGIFSNGFTDLGLYFKKIFSTNSFSDITDPLLTQFTVEF